jgi:hypothetical protein
MIDGRRGSRAAGWTAGHPGRPSLHVVRASFDPDDDTAVPPVINFPLGEVRRGAVVTYVQPRRALRGTPGPSSACCSGSTSRPRRSSPSGTRSSTSPARPARTSRSLLARPPSTHAGRAAARSARGHPADDREGRACHARRPGDRDGVLCSLPHARPRAYARTPRCGARACATADIQGSPCRAPPDSHQQSTTV